MQRGQVIASAWPRPFGKARSKAQRDAQTAFALMQTWAAEAAPSDINAAVLLSAGTTMTWHDILLECFAGNFVEYTTTGKPLA